MTVKPLEPAPKVNVLLDPLMVAVSVSFETLRKKALLNETSAAVALVIPLTRKVASAPAVLIVIN